jgi:hypothetical protein
MINNKHQLFLTTLIASIVLVFCAPPSPAADQSSTTASPLSQQTAKLIQELEVVKQTDWSAALDPSVSPVRHGTFLNQMNKADRASKELSHGFAVPPGEIEDALWVPPKHISPEERAQLIRQLKQVRQQDDQNEQNMLNNLAWSRSAAPVDTAIFDQRMQEVDTVITDLKIGAPVHWSAIKEALQVPYSPY